MTDETTIPDWAKDSLPETLHNIPFLKDAEGPEQFVTRLQSAAEHMGNSMRIPGPDAGEDTWKEFESKLSEKVPNLQRFDFDSEEGRANIMKKLGRPESHDGYGAEGDGAWLAEVALEAGLTKHQFDSLVTGVAAKNKATAETMTAEQAEQVDALFNEWGLSKPKKMEHIAGLLKLTNAPEGMAQNFADGKVDATTLQWMDTMAAQFSEAAKFSKDRNDPDSLTPLEAEAQIQELMSNPEYFNDNAIGRNLRTKMIELQSAAKPGASKNLDQFRADAGFTEMFGN
jgi:hypothetical protein